MAWSANIAILIICFSTAATTLVPYIIAVIQNHVDAFLPHIPATGDSPPESTIFTQLVVLTDAFFLLVVQIRYVQVAAISEANDVADPHRINLVSCCVGYITGSALLVLACFQACNALPVHATALICFSVGCVLYVLLQTVLSWRIRSYTETEKIVILRIVLAVLIVIVMSVYLIGMFSTKLKCCTAEDLLNSCRKENPIWTYYLLAAIAERSLLILYLGYMLSFWDEFKKIEISSTKIEVISQREESQDGT